MPNLMSMEDLFYGPPEPTWIMPTPHEPPRRYIEREVITERETVEPHPARQLRKPNDEPLRPVERYVAPRPAPPPIEHHHDYIRPIERLARIHTPPEPTSIRAPHEEIRKVVEVPVPVPVEVRVPVQVKVPVPVQVEVPVPVRVEVPVPVQVPVQVAVPTPAPLPVVKRNITPPVQRPIIHHPIELKVPMCCEKCAKKVKDKLLDLKGVENVVTDQYNQKVIVYGNADPARVLYRVKQVKKRSVFWDLSVDYSEKYRRVCEAQAEAARADAARAESARAEAAAARTDAARAESARAEAAAARARSQAKLQAMHPPAAVVQLPQERNGPAVTAILPERQTAMPYVANNELRRKRYVSPPKAYRQEFFHDPRHQQAPFYGGRHADHPSSFY